MSRALGLILIQPEACSGQDRLEGVCAALSQFAIRNSCCLFFCCWLWICQLGKFLAPSFSQTDAKVITLGSFFLSNSCLVYATTTLCELSVKQTFSLSFVTRVLIIEKGIRAFFFSFKLKKIKLSPPFSSLGWKLS